MRCPRYEEVKALYDDIPRALHGTTCAHYNVVVVMGDFNAKIGVQEGDELKIASNHRGQILVNFHEL